MNKNTERDDVMNNNNPRGSAAIAFLLGAVAGGIAALLLAPQSGAQTRRRLRRGAHDLREKGKQFALEMGERTDIVTGAMKGAMSEAKHTYRDEMDKRRAPAGMETKRSVEVDAAGDKVRASTQS
jgi:hypothetical protein